MAWAVAGCNPLTDRKYMNEGAGIDLNSSKMVDATVRQNEYIDQVCRQAGYQPYKEGHIASCMDRDGWTLFVQAGLNDIDQRCDSYLSWLDAKRRDREPTLRELAALGGAAHSILTVSGAGTDTLDIVSTAFALAAATYDNWSSRLLLAVNQSTVQDIVYTRQNQFRTTIKDEIVPDRPRAIYLLRNYLRICMPNTIEADINTSMTLVQRGNPMDAKDNPPVRPTVPPRRASFSIDKEPKAKDLAAGATTAVEKSIERPQLRRLQAMLCKVPDSGDFDAATRSGLADFNRSFFDDLSGKGTILDENRLTEMEKARLKIPPCNGTGLENSYEVGVFLRLQNAGVRKRLKDVLDKNNRSLAAAEQLPVPADLETLPAGNVIANAPLRSAITTLSSFYHKQDAQIPEGSQITDPFWRRVTSDIRRPAR